MDISNIEIVRDKWGIPHIYGKKETRPFRKMGHVTVIHPELIIARKTAEKVKDIISVIAK